MAFHDIDGAHLWLPEELSLLETIAFVDRRYLGVVASRKGSEMFYASLKRRSPPEEGEYAVPTWAAHTLHEAITDSSVHAKEIIMSAYEGLHERR
jgi:hypothetical protein